MLKTELRRSPKGRLIQLKGAIYGSQEKSKKKGYEHYSYGTRVLLHVSIAGSFDGFTLKLKGVKPNEVGRKQFYDYQTFGAYKHSVHGQPYKVIINGQHSEIILDDYFFVLQKGKEMFDFLTSEYKKMYDNGEWWGFYRLWIDWKGNRWLLPYLLSWFSKHTGRELPVWIDKEEPEEVILKYL